MPRLFWSSREAPPQSADPVVAATYAREHAVREKFVDIETAKARTQLRAWAGVGGGAGTATHTHTVWTVRPEQGEAQQEPRHWGWLVSGGGLGMVPLLRGCCRRPPAGGVHAPTRCSAPIQRGNPLFSTAFQQPACRRRASTRDSVAPARDFARRGRVYEEESACVLRHLPPFRPAPCRAAAGAAGPAARVLRARGR